MRRSCPGRTPYPRRGGGATVTTDQGDPSLWNGFAGGDGALRWEKDGKFHLFYSANRFDSREYAIGHAVAESPLGPFTKTAEPVVASNDVAAGPGHCALVRKSGKVWMLYHAWPPDAGGTEMPGRNLWLSEVAFAADGSVTVAPPTVDYPVRP